MTASTPRRSRSACHSGTGSAPAYRTARAASVSSSEPGNVTTPIRTPAAYPAAPQLSETASQALAPTPAARAPVPQHAPVTVGPSDSGEGVSQLRTDTLPGYSYG